MLPEARRTEAGEVQAEVISTLAKLFKQQCIPIRKLQLAKQKQLKRFAGKTTVVLFFFFPEGCSYE